MKKIIIIVFVALTLNSCADPGGEEVFEGFMFSFYEYTGEDYDVEVVIGGMENGIFKPTDSIKMETKLPALKKAYNFFFEDNRWQPDLNKIRAIPSEKCYFKIKLSNNRTEMIGRYNLPGLMSLSLPSGDVFVGDYGRLVISIRKDKITGNADSVL